MGSSGCWTGSGRAADRRKRMAESAKSYGVSHPPKHGGLPPLSPGSAVGAGEETRGQTRTAHVPFHHFDNVRRTIGAPGARKESQQGSPPFSCIVLAGLMGRSHNRIYCSDLPINPAPLLDCPTVLSPSEPSLAGRCWGVPL